MKVDIAVVGNLLIDELPGGVVEPGGAALYSALAAARAGMEVGLHSVVGSDYPLEVLEKAEVRLNLQRLPTAGGRAVISYGPRGRELLHQGPGHEAMTPQTPHPFEAALTILAPMPWEWQLYHLERCPPGTVLLEPYPTLTQERWRELCPLREQLRYLVLNREEIEMDTEQIPTDFPVLVKEGADGGYCRRSGARWQAVTVPVADPTGAGDSFVAGVAAGIIRGYEPERCFGLGAQLASEVIQAVGARAFF